MSMILEISAESGFLHVTATGEFSLVEAKRTFIEVLEAVARNKVGTVLFDGRALTGNPEMMERFYYGEFAAREVQKFISCGEFPRQSLRTFLKFQYLTLGSSAKPWH